MSEGPVPIDVGQLLIIDPNAYVNLTLMFPCNAKTLDEIEAFVLPKEYRLLLVGPGQVVLVCKQPAAVLVYNKKEYKWEPMQMPARKP